MSRLGILVSGFLGLWLDRVNSPGVILRYRTHLGRHCAFGLDYVYRNMSLSKTRGMQDVTVIRPACWTGLFKAAPCRAA